MCVDDGAQIDFDFDELDQVMENNLKDICTLLENHKLT